MSNLGAFSSNYLESIAKSPVAPGKTPFFGEPKTPSFFIPGRKKNGDGLSRGLEGDNVPLHCGKWAMIGRCGCGRHFAKSLDCGREWCPRCKESAHGRRMARWLSKAFKMDIMGYLVITFPEGQRPRTKKALSRIGTLITEALIRRGYKRGLRRWHFFGEKSNAWHPHLNFLFESGYLDDEKLESIKKLIREILGLDNAVIYYQYSQAVNKKIHWIKYVSRPTFLKKKWDVAMAVELHNFRNSVSWGKWADKDKWSFPAGTEKTLGYRAKIGGGICPACDSKIEWSRPVKIDELFEKGFDEIWPGIWQERPPPEKVLEFEFFKKLDRINRNNGK
ncbi:hypothetical protein ES703_79756 [subsurface metagenome]